MADKNLDNLEKDLLSPILKDEIDDISQLSDVIIDSLVKNDLLKQIPYISILMSAHRAGMAIRDILFMKKLFRLLNQINDVPQQEREEFVKKVNSDSKYKQKVGETLIMAIERLDNIEKSDYLAKLLIGVVKGIITFDTFLRLSYALDRAFFSDLVVMVDYFKKGKILIGDSTIWERLFSCGLSNVEAGVSQTIRMTQTDVNSHYPVYYDPNSEAELFASLIIEK